MLLLWPSCEREREWWWTWWWVCCWCEDRRQLPWRANGGGWGATFAPPLHCLLRQFWACLADGQVSSLLQWYNGRTGQSGSIIWLCEQRWWWWWLCWWCAGRPWWWLCWWWWCRQQFTLFSSIFSRNNSHKSGRIEVAALRAAAACSLHFFRWWSGEAVQSWIISGERFRQPRNDSLLGVRIWSNLAGVEVVLAVHSCWWWFKFSWIVTLRFFRNFDAAAALLHFCRALLLLLLLLLGVCCSESLVDSDCFSDEVTVRWTLIVFLPPCGTAMESFRAA